MKTSIKALFLVCLCPTMASAQNQLNVDSVASEATEALNNLDYRRAEQLARTIVTFEHATEAQTIRGLQLLTASFFPEEDVAQQPDSAVTYIRELLEVAPDATMPSAISWPGLDAMLTATSRTVFAVRADPQSEYALDGIGTQGAIPVVATRPASFTLLTRRDGAAAAIVMDSTGPTTRGELRFHVADFDSVTMPGGRYEFLVVATDSLTRQSTEMSYAVDIIAPRIGLVPIPMSLDSSQILPERTSRNRVRNTLIGVGLGAVTGFIATAFRGSEPVSSVGLDNRAYVMGGGMTLGGIIGVFTDRAAPVPANIAHNARIRADHADFVRLSRDQNNERRLSYHATVTFVGRTR